MDIAWGNLLLGSLWFFLPIGVANMAPVLFSSVGKSLAVPIDSGKLFMGKPLFGSHKTWRGLLFGTLAGGIIFFMQVGVFAAFPSVRTISLFNYLEVPLWTGLLLGFGAIFGDLIKSFLKRRISVKPGERWFPFDQIDYLLGGLLMIAVVNPLVWQAWVAVVVIGLILHVITNNIGFALGLKDTRW